jgi:hypothetical protein
LAVLRVDRVLLLPARPEDIIDASATIRQADRDECRAAFGREVETMLLQTLCRSAEAWTAIVDHEIVCLFGLAPISMATGLAAPWLVTTEAIERNVRPFLSCSRERIARWRGLWPHLANWVDERNYKAIRWLRWLGATLEPAAPYGVERRPFHRFYWGP